MDIDVVPIISIIDLLGLISFAMSGSFAAMQNRLDPFGVFIIAFVTSVGGGTIRDLLLDKPVFWIYDLRTFNIILLCAVIAMIFKSVEKNFKVTLFVFDSLGLGLFTIVGIEKGIGAGLHPVMCITLGTITGCFGGVIRDILINRIPLLLREEIYAVACIIGGLFFMAFYPYLGDNSAWLQILTVAIVFFTRHFSVKYQLHIPMFYLSSEEKVKRGVSRVFYRRRKGKK